MLRRTNYGSKAWSIPPDAGEYIQLLLRSSAWIKIGLGGVSLCILVASRGPEGNLSDLDIGQATGLHGAGLRRAKTLAVQHGWLQIQQISKQYASYSTRTPSAFGDPATSLNTPGLQSSPHR